MSDSGTPTAYFITTTGERWAVTNPSYINSISTFVCTGDRGVLIGKDKGAGAKLVPQTCRACGSSEIAIGTTQGLRYWTCSTCGINGDL